MPLHYALFIEASPGPVKFAAAELGLCNENVRLPLVAPEKNSREIIRSALRHAGLLD